MRVRHATLHNVLGRSATHNGITIVPAELELEGTSFSPEFPLREFQPQRIPPILSAPIEHKYDVAWVRGRIPRVFGFTPEQTEAEKALISVGFVAVPEGAVEGLAFECSDYYGETSLYFSEEESNQIGKARVAEAFWSVLLAEPNDIENFEAKVLHLGAFVMMHFGCEDGEPFYYETEE